MVSVPETGAVQKAPEEWSEAKSTDFTCRRSHDQQVTVKLLKDNTVMLPHMSRLCSMVTTLHEVHIPAAGVPLQSTAWPWELA